VGTSLYYGLAMGRQAAVAKHASTSSDNNLKQERKLSCGCFATALFSMSQHVNRDVQGEGSQQQKSIQAHC
jgi:hypothetical protein